MDPTQFDVRVPDRSLGQQIGNAMSVNVVERVLLKALKAASLIADDSIDQWESREAISRISETRGKSFQIAAHRRKNSRKVTYKPSPSSVYC